MWIPRRYMKLRVTPGFFLLMGVLYYLDEGVEFLPWCLLACGVHELGHVTAAALWGGRAECLVLSVVGAELSLSYPKPLSYGEESLVALGGPLANFGLFFLAVWAELPLLAVFSIGIGGFNLLPIQPMGGARVLSNTLYAHLEPRRAGQWITVISALFVGIMVGLGAIAAKYFANWTLLLTSLWFVWEMLDMMPGGINKKKIQKK